MLAVLPRLQKSKKRDESHAGWRLQKPIEPVFLFSPRTLARPGGGRIKIFANYRGESTASRALDLDETMRSTVAPISKVGSQGHSPLPYQAGRRDRKWRSCRIRARARIERESRCACLPAACPPLSSCVSFALSLLLLSLQVKILVTRARCPHDPHHGPPLTDKGPFVTLATSFLIFLPLLPPVALLLFHLRRSPPRRPRRPRRRCHTTDAVSMWCTFATLITARIDATLDYVADFIGDGSRRSRYFCLPTTLHRESCSRLTRATITFGRSPVVPDHRYLDVTWHERKLLLGNR